MIGRQGMYVTVLDVRRRTANPNHVFTRLHLHNNGPLAASARSRRALAIVVTAAAASLLAGCGGGSHKSSTTTTKASTTTSAPKHSTHRATTRTALSETVSVVTGTTKGPASASARAKVDDEIVFHTLLPGNSKSPPTRVKLTLTNRPASRWTVTAAANGQRSTATVQSASAAPLTLVAVHYTCELPPVPTICPARKVSASSKRVTVQFKAAAATPISLSATAGPIPGTKTPASSGSAVVPAYTPTETVEARSLSTTKPKALSVPTATASAKPGDEVVLETHLKGTVDGAPQPLTITFDQGPAKVLKVSAAVPGGTPSTATVTSANGQPIALVLPHYVCYLPPFRSSCPPSKVTTRFHGYTLTFPADPHTLVRIIATVQAG
jgi:hypothetical protein